MTRNSLRTFLLTAAAVAGCASICTAQEGFIAGTSPDRRPAGAPVVQDYSKDAAWYAQALAGVEPPYPASLRFLEDQGAWFSPFDRPGMSGPYDLRGLHVSPMPSAR